MKGIFNLYYQIELILEKDDADTLSVFLDLPKNFPDLSGYYEVLYDAEKENSDKTKLMLYFPQEEEQCDIKTRILLTTLNIENYSITKNKIIPEDYLENYKKYYLPFRVSNRLSIIPSWHKGSPEEREVLSEKSLPLYIDPGLAFGTGLHATTRMCLKHLENIPLTGMDIIDAGCGSGILSIAALILGAKSVFAFDVDGNAVTSTNHNALLNNIISEKLEVVKGSFDLPQFTSHSANLLLANLTEQILLANQKIIQSGQYSRMLISGLIQERKSDVIKAFEKEWTLLYEDMDDEWILLDFQRR